MLYTDIYKLCNGEELLANQLATALNIRDDQLETLFIIRKEVKPSKAHLNGWYIIKWASLRVWKPYRFNEAVSLFNGKFVKLDIVADIFEISHRDVCELFHIEYKKRYNSYVAYARIRNGKETR